MNVGSRAVERNPPGSERGNRSDSRHDVIELYTNSCHNFHHNRFINNIKFTFGRLISGYVIKFVINLRALNGTNGGSSLENLRVGPAARVSAQVVPTP